METKLNNILVASYTHRDKNQYTKIGGPALDLINFLVPRSKKLVAVLGPLPVSDTLAPQIEFWQNFGQRHQRWILPFPNLPWGRKKEISYLDFLGKLRDAIALALTVIFGFRKYDLAIAVESVNALTCICLKKLGLIKSIVYYSLDYGEKRFNNRFLNRVFHYLDQKAASQVDIIWNLSSRIGQTRVKLVQGRRMAPQIVVPIGMERGRTRLKPFVQRERFRIIYLGSMSHNAGALVALEATIKSLKQEKRANAVFIGTGRFEKKMQERIKESGMGQKIIWRGVCSDQKVEEILASAGLGLAPYFIEESSYKAYTDVTKPRMYLAFGLPTIISSVPPVAQEIAQRRAGVVVNTNNPADYAKEILKIFKDQKLHHRLSKNALALGQQYNWSNIWQGALSQTQKFLSPKRL